VEYEGMPGLWTLKSGRVGKQMARVSPCASGVERVSVPH